MGSILSLSADELPNTCTISEAKGIIQRLNALCKQNQYQVGINLELQPTSLQYHNQNWKSSLVSGYVTISRKPESQKFKIVMSMRQVYKAFDTMKHFQKQLEEEKMLTPSFITPDENVECCICLDKAPTMMLPCSHQFCDKCTQIHIIDQPQKICPLCRKQFKCGRQSLQRQIYQVVGEDENLQADLRDILLGILKELNIRQVNNIKKALKDNPQCDIMKE